MKHCLTVAARDVCEVANDLLRQMLDLYVKYSGKWEAIRTSEDFTAFVNATGELRASFSIVLIDFGRKRTCM